MLPAAPTGRFADDQAGQTTIEWALLLGALGIPLIYVTILLLGALCEHYRMVTFIETLPLP
jgi:Flp pilus assembly pilin Flp